LGWKHGLQKVSMTQTLHGCLDVSLKGANEITNRVLNGETVTLPPMALEDARMLASKLHEIGALTEIAGE
jgi:hypothetical protein